MSSAIHKNSIPFSEIARVVQDIAEHFQPEKIILFGSFASNSQHPGSDVDLLVIMSTDKTPVDQAIEIARGVEHHFGMDILVRTPQQFQERLALGDFFLQDIQKNGKVMYERSC